ncbi:MAG: AbrB/MazE/SpoVT family DNA-binding domain-containing protein [Deltaproteobacteria bacterium]
MVEEGKVLAFGEVYVRTARGGKNPPVIVTIPTEVVEAFKLKVGEKIDVITDGKKIVIKRREVKM